MNVAAGHTLNLDGQADTDSYSVITTGSQGDRRNYVINVLDTGAPDDGADTLSIYGADSPANGAEDPADDIFLLRRMKFIPNETAERPAFVALLHGTLDQVRASDPDNDPAVRPQEVQRINYDARINGRLQVFGLGGNDYFAVDDNSAITTLDGGAGRDTFQVGQVFGPLVNADGRIAFDLGAAPSDDFSEWIIRTTLGFLSPGATFPLVAQGGTGDDAFIVYSNQAELRLEGDADNDEFLVRSFALADEFGQPLIGSSTEGQTNILPGEGDDIIQYNINAPVSIDGGTGFDKVVVLGTEFEDDFVISEDGIFGGGVNTRYDNVEVVEVDGLEGDDEFFVISTPFGVATRVIGGLGSDTFNVLGDVTEPIVAQELEGRSGLINHQVQSADDEGYDGLLAPGLDLHVADPVLGQVVIEEADGATVVREGGPQDVDTYTLRLAAQPTAPVYVTVSAARSAQEEADAGGDSVWLRTAGDPASFLQTVMINGVATCRCRSARSCCGSTAATGLRRRRSSSRRRTTPCRKANGWSPSATARSATIRISTRWRFAMSRSPSRMTTSPTCSSSKPPAARGSWKAT